jgi:hypothetical protein
LSDSFFFFVFKVLKNIYEKNLKVNFETVGLASIRRSCPTPTRRRRRRRRRNRAYLRSPANNCAENLSPKKRIEAEKKGRSRRRRRRRRGG